MTEDSSDKTSDEERQQGTEIEEQDTEVESSEPVEGPPDLQVSADDQVEVVEVTEEVVGGEETGAPPPIQVTGRPRFLADDVRALLAAAFVVIFFILICLSFWALYKYGKSWGDAMDLIQQLLPAITALLGSAVGFYFGTRAGQPEE